MVAVLLLLFYVLPTAIALRMSGLFGRKTGLSGRDFAFEAFLVFCPLINIAMVGACLYCEATGQ